MMTQDTHSTYLIVGAGVFGASTAYHLSKHVAPSSITVIDRTSLPPAPAASTDINKIIRADYSDPFYCNLAYEAIDAWSSWPELKPFYHRTGWVMLDEEGSDLAERTRKVFRDRGLDPTKDIPLKELGRDDRWGGILKDTDTKGFRDAYWNPEAGWCEAANATAKIMEAAIGYGVRYVQGEVSSLMSDSNNHIHGIRTHDGQTYTAEKMILATGAWTSALLSPLEDTLEIPIPDRIEAQASAAGVAVAHYRLTATEMTSLHSMPVLVYGENGEVIPPPAQNRLLKYTNAHTFSNTIVTPSGHAISVPPDRDQRIVPRRLRHETQKLMMDRVLPSYARSKEAEYWRLCWDARTPSQDWLLCRHPDARLSNLFFAIGGSFHSYKFLPTVGRYMANVVLGRSNGGEEDRRWGWKKDGFKGRGAHEKTAPKRELRELEDEVARL